MKVSIKGGQPTGSGISAPEPDLSDLAACVAKMRALGVTKWGDIELGPVPEVRHPLPPPMTDFEIKKAARLEHERRRIRNELLDFGAAEGLPDDIEQAIDEILAKQEEAETQPAPSV